MLIYQFHHYVKHECVESYRAAILVNARKSIQEPGVLRFDVLQDQNDPSHFCLFEIYRDEEGRAAHLEAEHFKAFRQAVVEGGMLAQRTSDQFKALFLEADWK